jgi:hypothetical protein
MIHNCMGGIEACRLMGGESDWCDDAVDMELMKIQ